MESACPREGPTKQEWSSEKRTAFFCESEASPPCPVCREEDPGLLCCGEPAVVALSCTDIAFLRILRASRPLLGEIAGAVIAAE